MEKINSSKMIELLTKVMSDPLPSKKIKAGYIFSQAEANYESTLEAGVELIKGGRVEQIFTIDASIILPTLKGIRKILNNYSEFVNILHLLGKTVNTLVEAELLIKKAQTAKWSEVVIVAAPFHQLRAFITTVSIASKKMPNLKIYNYVGQPLTWDQTVYHSQGTLKGTRTSFIYSELERIEKYTAKGNLLPIEDILDYLNKR